MENNNIDIHGTDMIFLDLRREVLPGDSKVCQRCDAKIKDFYWKFGIVKVDQRAKDLCDTCHEEII